MSTCQCCGSKFDCHCTPTDLNTYEIKELIRKAKDNPLGVWPQKIPEVQATLSTRNYWRRLIAAHLYACGAWEGYEARMLVRCTDLIDELEKIEAEEAEGKK